MREVGRVGGQDEGSPPCVIVRLMAAVVVEVELVMRVVLRGQWMVGHHRCRRCTRLGRARQRAAAAG